MNFEKSRFNHSVYKRSTLDLRAYIGRIERMENIPCTQPKTAEVSMLISDKVKFKIKTATKDKGRHCIVISGSIHQEDTIIARCMLQTSEYLNTGSKF